MFVVRITNSDGGLDCKAFERRPAATAWFTDACDRLADGESSSVALFVVPEAPDVRAACEAVKAQKGISLLDLKVDEATMSRQRLDRLFAVFDAK